jgi:hypothetical protein
MNKQTEGSVLRYACDKLVSVNAKSALTAGQTILAWGAMLAAFDGRLELWFH